MSITVQDVQSLGVLTSAIKEYQGTLLVISHDEYFIKEIEANKFIKLSNETLCQ